MTIKLENLENIATIVKIKYGNILDKMNFIFCCKKDVNSYFIFQEIQGMPIKRLIYHKENYSVTFAASWAAWGSPYSLIADANLDQIENWKDLLDRTRPYNSQINDSGGFNTNRWICVDKNNKTEKKKRHKNKTDAFVEFRIDRIRRANFNAWGFELYGEPISMIGFFQRGQFPYPVSDVEQPTGPVEIPVEMSFAPIINVYFPTPSSSDSPPSDTDEYDIPVNEISWQGGSFSVPEFQEQAEISQVSSPNAPGGHCCDLTSYWDINESSKENAAFDEEIANIILGDDTNENILEVGQRKVDLYFGD